MTWTPEKRRSSLRAAAQLVRADMRALAYRDGTERADYAAAVLDRAAEVVAHDREADKEAAIRKLVATVTSWSRRGRA